MSECPARVGEVMETPHRIGAALACALAAPFALPAEPAAAQASDQAYQTIKSLGAAMDRCWFAANDPAFAGYILFAGAERHRPVRAS